MKVKLKWEYDYGLDTQQKQIIIGERATTQLGDAVIRITPDTAKLRYEQPYALKLLGSSCYTYHANPASAKAHAEALMTDRLNAFIKTCTSNT